MQQQSKSKNHKKLKKQKKLWRRDLGHLYSIYAYIISGNRILSGEKHGSSGAAGGAEFLKSGGVVVLNVSYLAMWPGESVLSQRGCHNLKLSNLYIYLFMFCWPCISIHPCNENQLDALSILSLFRQ